MKNVQLAIMVLAAIFAMSAFSVDARLNHQLALKAMGINMVTSGTGGEKLCPSCLCNKKYPPDCWCGDLGEKCYSACACICSQYPLPLLPTCYCEDNEKNLCPIDVAEKQPDKE